MCPNSETSLEGHADPFKCPVINYCCGNDNCSSFRWVLCFNNYHPAVWFFIAREVSPRKNTLMDVFSSFSGSGKHEIQFRVIELIHIQAVITVPRRWKVYGCLFERSPISLPRSQLRLAIASLVKTVYFPQNVFLFIYVWFWVLEWVFLLATNAAFWNQSEWQ